MDPCPWLYEEEIYDGWRWIDLLFVAKMPAWKISFLTSDQGQHVKIISYYELLINDKFEQEKNSLIHLFRYRIAEKLITNAHAF